MSSLKNICFLSLIGLIFLSENSFALDSLNRIDENNLKQGRWVYTNKTRKLPSYGENQIVEEGTYINDKKIGKWLYYYNNDKVKHILTYSDNRPDGYAVFYYKNGNKREEGIWKNNKWIGEYKFYYSNGNLRSDWKYNENGQRTGVQKYYFETGQLKIEGEWQNGKESGVITEYHEDGSVKSERSFENGKIDLVASKNYSPQEKEGKVTIKKIDSLNIDLKKVKEIKAITIKDNLNVPEKSASKKDNIPWSGTGTRQFFNKNGQVIREGYFEKGYLMDGKVYMFSSDGKKTRTTEYKGGRIIKETNHRKKK